MDPRYTFSGDGVHPNATGHEVMAQALLRGLGVSGESLAGEFDQYNAPDSKRAQIFALVHRRQRILTDAWLTATGHQRPMSPGLPLDEAQQKAALLTEQIRERIEE